MSTTWPDTTLNFTDWQPPKDTMFVIATERDGSFKALIYGHDNEWKRLGSDYIYTSKNDACEGVQRSVDF